MPVLEIIQCECGDKIHREQIWLHLKFCRAGAEALEGTEFESRVEANTVKREQPIIRRRPLKDHPKKKKSISNNNISKSKRKKKKKAKSTTVIYSYSVYRQPRVHKKHSNWSPPLKPREKNEATCPVCSGDGGAISCYKCDGTGWVSLASQRKYSAKNITRKEHTDNTRVSNANYPADHLGAHYRDRDGRFGSIPSYDDYSEEGEV